MAETTAKFVKSDALSAALAEVKVKVDGSIADAKSYADNKIAALVGGAPETLDTLKEISDALGADANLSATLTAQIATKANASELSKYQTIAGLDAAMLAKYPNLANLGNYATKTELTNATKDCVKASELDALAMTEAEARAIVTNV